MSLSDSLSYFTSSLLVAMLSQSFVTCQGRQDETQGCQTVEDSSINQTPPRQGSARSGDAEGHLQFQMAMQKTDALDTLLAQLYDPKHPNFRKFLTPEQFRERFYPTFGQRRQLREHLLNHGMEMDEHDVNDSSGLMVHACGKVSQLEAATGSPYQTFDHDGALFLAPAQSLKDDGMAHVRAIGGSVLGIGKVSPRAMPRTSQGAFTPAQLRKAYQVPADASTATQSIGVIALEGYDPADIARYAKANGIREVPRRHVFLRGFDGKPRDPGGQAETTLDISVLNGIAPDAKEIVVYGALNRGNALVSVLDRIANPQPGEPLVRVVSCSWGAPESQMGQADAKAEHDILRQLAAQGVTVISASGDAGAYDDGVRIGTDSPAAQPWCLAAGGTTLQTEPDGKWKQELGWRGSGGGASCYWKSPAWQQGPFAQYLHRLPQWRQVPDWAAHADPTPGYALWVNGDATSVGGTSAAAPLLAGVVAMAEHARQVKGQPPLGFAAPALYRAAEATDWTAFNDILLGDNRGDKNSGGFKASLRYDNVTGAGSPRVDALLKALVD